LVYEGHFRTRVEAQAAIQEYIEVFYKRIRLHSTLDYRTPVKYQDARAREAA